MHASTASACFRKLSEAVYSHSKRHADSRSNTVFSAFSPFIIPVSPVNSIRLATKYLDTVREFPQIVPVAFGMQAGCTLCGNSRSHLGPVVDAPLWHLSTT